jgi:Raf kinase inhibitor-like YbhB/YbcL family protein
MKTLLTVVIFLLGLATTVAYAEMRLTSEAFSEGGPIPLRHTCEGTNVNPPLRLEGVPSETKTLVLIVDDPDAARTTWTHWVVYNIPPNRIAIEENSNPGTEAVNDFEKTTYGGPCPPRGEHRYFFRAYALDKPLTLKSENFPTRKEVEQSMAGSVLAKAELMGRYRLGRSLP